jgi:3-methyladenine DNA glycosylase AlkD
MPAASSKAMAAATVEAFRRHFSALGATARAAQQKAYLKSELSFHGVTVPIIRAEVRAFGKRQPLARGPLRATVDAFFATPFHDLRSAGIGILEQAHGQLESVDLDWLIELVRRSGNWAHVDWLATKVVGPVITRTGDRAARLRAWAGDDDFWVRRTALLAQHDELRAGRGDFALFEELAVPMLDDKEFFIRKAIGWVLREVSRRRPQLTRAFMKRHGSRMSGVTWREAARRLPSPPARPGT